MKHVVIFIAVVLGLSGLGLWQLSNLNAKNKPTTLIEHVPYAIQFKLKGNIEDNLPEKATLKVTRDGAPLDLLQNSQSLHLTLVSRDLSDTALFDIFNDLVQIRPGTFEFTHQFNQQPYTVWIEVNNLATGDHHGDDKVEYLGSIALLDDSAVPADMASPVQTSLTASGFQMNLLAGQILAGKPARLSWEVADNTGNSVPLIKNVDHYYVLVSANPPFYMMRHVDQAKTEANKATSQLISFPKAGRYGVVMTALTDAGINLATGKQKTEPVTGSFIVDVTD